VSNKFLNYKQLQILDYQSVISEGELIFFVMITYWSDKILRNALTYNWIKLIRP